MDRTGGIVGIIYIITNSINSKVYIGSTYNTLENRCIMHVNESMKQESGVYVRNDKLYTAMRELGVDKFKIDILGTFKADELAEQRDKFITSYDSIHNGYNQYTQKKIRMVNELRAENIDDIILLLKCRKIGMHKIAELTSTTLHVIRMVAEKYGVECSQLVDIKKETLIETVYGVQRKSGHMVQFNNMYLAAEEIEYAGLSKQDTYFIRNDIRRSITQPNYGVAGYKWFNAIDKAKEYRDSLQGKERYEIIEIQDSVLTEARLKPKEPSKYAIRQNELEERLSKLSTKYPPDRELLMELILYYTPNRIATHYGVAFKSIAQLLERYGLPSTKEGINEYRNQYRKLVNDEYIKEAKYEPTVENMGGYIYKITNTINGKAYVGKTLKTAQERFIQHIKDSKRPEYANKILYRAFNKYGISNFKLEELEHVIDTSELDDREIYWIKKLDTYHNGYNATLGGDGGAYINRDAVVEAYFNCFNADEVATSIGVHEATVRDILRECGIPYINLHILSKPVYTLHNGKIVIFTSLMSASKLIYVTKTGKMDYIIDGKTNSDISGIASHVRKALDTFGTSYGHIWGRVSREDYCKVLKQHIEEKPGVEYKDFYGEAILICTQSNSNG